MREGTAGVRSSMVGPPAVYNTAGQRENHAFSRKRHPADVRPNTNGGLIALSDCDVIGVSGVHGQCASGPPAVCRRGGLLPGCPAVLGEMHFVRASHIDTAAIMGIDRNRA